MSRVRSARDRALLEQMRVFEEGIRAQYKDSNDDDKKELKKKYGNFLVGLGGKKSRRKRKTKRRRKRKTKRRRKSRKRRRR